MDMQVEYFFETPVSALKTTWYDNADNTININIIIQPSIIPKGLITGGEFCADPFLLTSTTYQSI
jgi:hypothetical protein